ncbi:LPS-assembly protein LptD, partial [bacterium]|nr:LPS-assembly protein LptD [bacterium]
KQMMLDCDTVKTDQKTGEIEAVGNPVLEFPTQKIKLTANKMIYNPDSNILKAIGNVVLTKDGTPVYGDFIQVNMNEENIFMDNVRMEAPSLQVNAKSVVSDNDKLVLSDGYMASSKGSKFNFVSRMIGPDFRKMIIDEDDKNLLLTEGESSWKLVASEVGVDASNSHDIFSVKDAELYHNDKYLFTIPSFKAYTNKSREYFEANYPEFGSVSRFGMFAGPGIVYRAPFGSTLKFIPLINYKNEFGVGAAFKFKSSFNDTHLMYGSGADIFRLKGKQYLDENLYLQYSSNAYSDDWFLGRRMAKYLAEVVYQKSNNLKDFLAEDKDLKFTQRASVAYAQDGEWNMHTEHIKSSGIGTSRFRYMAEVDQSLFKRIDKENRRAVELSMLMQGSAAVYGTGDTQFVGRVGPRLHTQYKYWMQDLAYFVSGYSDQTPMPVYDMYRYGHSNLRLREALRVNKYLTVGWAGSITLTDDSPNGKMFQENMFMFSIGPDDFKVNLGYDFMRKMTYFIVSVILDTKNDSVTFDKMEIKNAERLGRSEQDDSKNMAFKPMNANNKVKKLQYAEVIDIEDPDKESI